MKSDAEIERQLEDLLEQEAEPMPPPVLEAVLEGVSRRSQERATGPFPFVWLGRAVIPAAAVAVVIATFILAPNVVPGLQDAWRRVVGSSPDASLVDERMHWDAMLQFRELNPAPDAYGHAVVFTYLRSNGPDHEPTEYVPLPTYDSSEERWYDPEFEELAVGSFMDQLTLHPYGGGADSRAAIVAWRSPITAALRVAGSVEVDATCGDGIIFSIEHGSEVFETLELPNGSRTFEHLLDRFDAGQVLYFIVEPGADSRCDATRFNVTIDTR